jgi:hypothetical protein
MLRLANHSTSGGTSAGFLELGGREQAIAGDNLGRQLIVCGVVGHRPPPGKICYQE